MIQKIVLYIGNTPLFKRHNVEGTFHHSSICHDTEVHAETVGNKKDRGFVKFVPWMKEGGIFL